MSAEETRNRKLEHINICLNKDVEFSKTNGFERFEVKGSPDRNGKVNKDEVDLSTEFLGKQFRLPFFIEAMTGGAAGTEKINQNLARAAQELGIGMGVGSQRAAIEDPSVAYTYNVRVVAPDILLLGNLGIAQVMKYSIEDVKRAVEMINADALAIHYNPLQEKTQPEGDRDFDGAFDVVRSVCSSVDFPVVAKEVGFGMLGETAKAFEGAGVSAIDVAGAGGTNWVRAETYRHKTMPDIEMEKSKPTADALLECRKAVTIPLIASGGMRTAKDCVKALAMGASLVGFALPLLKPATESWEAVREWLESMASGLREEMASLGVKNLEELRKLDVVESGQHSK